MDLIISQELTEEGIPFLILFHHPDDTDTPERFRSIVASELTDQKSQSVLYCCYCLLQV